jgi:hypothetical protein
MRRTAVTAALCLAAACGTDPSAPPADVSQAASLPSGTMAAASATCQNVNRNDGDFPDRQFDCGWHVLVTSPAQQLSDAIPGAIGIWNSVVFGHDNFPKFERSGYTGTLRDTVRVVFDNTTGPYHCGTTNPDADLITIHRSSAPTNCKNNFTNAVDSNGLHRLIAHELSHVIGFKHISDAGLRRPAADHCIASLPQNGGFNGTNCQAEIEILHFNYGLRDTDINPAKHILTGMELSGPSQVDSGRSATIEVNALLFSRAAPSFTPPGLTLLRYAWSSDSSAIARPSAGDSYSNVIQGVAPGSTTIQVQLSGTTYERAEPLIGNRKAITVLPGPPPPPIGLNVTGIEYNFVTVRWTNATESVSTVVEIRLRGATQWTPTAATAVGATSRNIGGLSAETDYEIHAKHVRNNQSSVFTSPVVSFTTDPLPAPTITIFRPTRCTQQSSGGKLYNYFTMSWNASPAQVEGSYEIGWAIGGSLTPKLLLTVPGTQTSGQVGGYLSTPQLTNLWFWIRYVRTGISATPWVPLNPNPLAVNNCAV